MILTKKQMSLIAVLGTSVIGFVVDKVLLDPGAPQAVSAASVAPRPTAPAPKRAPAAAPAAAERAPAAPASASAKSAGAAAAPASGAAGVALADRLKALSLADREPADIREAFAPSAAWLATLEVAKPAAAAPEADSVADFAKQHKLTSVLRRGKGGSAIVDGKFIEIGEQVDGYRLIGLTSDSAAFRSPRQPKDVTLFIVGAGK